MHGPAGAAAAVRADLLAAGWVESDWRPRHVVVGLPVDQLLAQHWDAATRSGSGLRWTTLWRRRRTLGGLPAPVDLLALAGRLRGEGQDRVAVVLGRDLADLRTRTASTLGLPTPADPGRTAGVDGRAGDLRRRLNPLLALAADGTTAAHLRAVLTLVLDPLAHPPVPPACPPRGAPGPTPRPRRWPPGCGRLTTLSTATRDWWGNWRRAPTCVAPASTRSIPTAPWSSPWRPASGRGGSRKDETDVTSGRPRRVILHVGTPKTGTSFVQDILFRNADELRRLGVLYPADRPDGHFLAALDLMELPWGGLEAQAVGAWDRLAADVRAWDGHTVVVSHEILGRASRAQVARALASLTEGSPETEVHVVVSARDLVRQVPAEWQENVKHRRVRTYRTFLEELQDPTRDSELAQWFWGVQELPDVLERWGSTLPPEQVHVVTVPQPGAGPLVLWERFAGLFGLDPDAFPPSERANVSLGVPESEMVRRLNTRLNDVLPNHHYRSLVREMVVHRNLSGRSGSPRLALPPDAYDWAAGLARAWVEELRTRGYAVAGDLDELLPGEARPFVDPDAVDAEQVADAALDALTVMTLEAAKLRDVEVELHGVIAERDAEIERCHGTRGYKAKERFVRMSETNVVARGGLSAYRRLRARNSRSA